jgi:hypothetical protein
VILGGYLKVEGLSFKVGHYQLSGLVHTKVGAVKWVILE